jgi:lysozyme
MGPRGTALLEGSEGCEKKRPDGLIESYWDAIGKVWTIGWGHTGPVNGHPLGPGVTITQGAADALLAEDLRVYEVCVENVLSRPTSQLQFDAFVDFTYNDGCAAFRGSHLLLLFNSGLFQEAADELLKWDHDGQGNEIPGLKRRREAERALFLEGTQANAPALPAAPPPSSPAAATPGQPASTPVTTPTILIPPRLTVKALEDMIRQVMRNVGFRV